MFKEYIYWLQKGMLWDVFFMVQPMRGALQATFSTYDFSTVFKRLSAINQVYLLMERYICVKSKNDKQNKFEKHGLHFYIFEAKP